MADKVFTSAPVYNPDWRGGGESAVAEIDRGTPPVVALVDSLKANHEAALTDHVNTTGAVAADAYRRIETVLDNATYRVLEAHDAAVNSLENRMVDRFAGLGQSLQRVVELTGAAAPDTAVGGGSSQEPQNLPAYQGVYPGTTIPEGGGEPPAAGPAPLPEPIPVCPPGTVFYGGVCQPVPQATGPPVTSVPPTWYQPSPPVSPPVFVPSFPSPQVSPVSPPVVSRLPMVVPASPAPPAPQQQPLKIEVSCTAPQSFPHEAPQQTTLTPEACEQPKPRLEQTPDPFLAWLFREGSCGGERGFRDWLPDAYDNIAKTKNAAELKDLADHGWTEPGK